MAERQPFVHESRIDLELGSLRGGHRALDQALQLSDVSGPPYFCSRFIDASEMLTTAPIRRAC
jgi:hypothetical protein